VPRRPHEGASRVDKQMRTRDPDIFDVGGSVERPDARKLCRHADSASLTSPQGLPSATPRRAPLRRRLARPARKGAGEGARVRVAETVSNLDDRQVRILEKLTGDGVARFVAQLHEALALGGKATVQRSGAQADVLRH
jgi:hypothetical protein